MTRSAPRRYPITPDGRYFVVKGRLWRAANPNLSEGTRQRLVQELMKARRDVGAALRRDDKSAVQEARSRVNAAKTGLGERGPVWWQSGDDDHNRRLAENSPYADWFSALET